MKERPILFSATMVRAILNGTKTQTRRVVKTQPESHQHIARHLHDGAWQFVNDVHMLADSASTWHCPYGQPGARIWVREAFAVQPDLWRASHGPQPLHYLADVSDLRQIEDYTGKPSIHMPRWASRITLEITVVRVERLQEISDLDAKAEGVTSDRSPKKPSWTPNKVAFCVLWESIYGPGSWEENPWVWVVEFKRVMP